MISSRYRRPVLCPCMCRTRHSHGKNKRAVLGVVYGRLPGMTKSEPFIYKCPVCGFECWYDSQTRSKYGSEEQAAWEVAGISHGSYLHLKNPPEGKRTRITIVIREVAAQ